MRKNETLSPASGSSGTARLQVSLVSPLASVWSVRPVTSYGAVLSFVTSRWVESALARRLPLVSLS